MIRLGGARRGIRVVGSSGPAPPATQAMDMVVAPLTGSIGDVITLVSFNSAVQGTPFGTSSLIGATSPTVSLTLTKLAAAAATPMPVPMKVGATIYDGTTNLSIQFDCNNPSPADAASTWEGVQVQDGFAVPNLLVVGYAKFGNLPDPDNLVSINNDWFNVAGDRGFSVFQQVQDSDGRDIFHGHSDGELGNVVEISDRTKIYEYVVFYDNTNSIGQYLLLDGNTVVGSSDSLMSGSTGTVSYLQFHNYLTNRVGLVPFYLVGLNWTNPTFPNRFIVVPDVTGMGLVQTASNTLTLTFNSVVTRFNIDISADGGAHWTRIESNLRLKTVTVEKTYDDATLSDGVTYSFRVSALIGSLESGLVTSADVTVDNNPFSGAWYDILLPAGADTDGPSDSSVSVAQRFLSPATGILSRTRIYSVAPADTTNGLKAALYNNSNVLLSSGIVSSGGGQNAYTEITHDVGVAVTLADPLKYGFIAEHTNDYILRYASIPGTIDYSFAYTYGTFGPPNPFVADGNAPRTYVFSVYIFTP